MAIKDTLKKVVKKATKKTEVAKDKGIPKMTRKEFMQKGFNKTTGYTK